jgi:hypothetical protein
MLSTIIELGTNVRYKFRHTSGCTQHIAPLLFLCYISHRRVCQVLDFLGQEGVATSLQYHRHCLHSRWSHLKPVHFKY